ncbi:MAG: PAS domain S-box protein [bacterium]|nr:PAS domain S-box protein [bacterium]
MTKYTTLEAVLENQVKVLDMITQQKPLKSIVQTLTEWIEKQSRDSLMATVTLIDPRSQLLKPIATSSFAADFFQLLYSKPIADQVTPCATAVITQKEQSVDCIQDDQRWPIFKKITRKYDIASSWSTPLVARNGTALGTLALYYPQQKTPTVGDMHIINLICQTAVIAIEQERVNAEKNDLILQLQKDKTVIQFGQRAGKIGTFIWNTVTGETEWTKEFEALYGYFDGGFIGGSTNEWLRYVHPADRADVKSSISEHLNNKRKMDFFIEFRVVWPDNSLHYLNTRAEIIRDAQGKVLQVVGVNIDITDRKQVENNLHFLSKVSTALSSSLDYKTTLTNVAKLAIPEIADWCTVHIKNGDQIEQLAITHIDPKKVKWAKELNAKSPVKVDDPNGVAEVLRTGESQYVKFISEELIDASAKNKKEAALLKKLQLTSIMIVPLMSDTKPVGVLTFVSAESKRQYTQSDLMMAEQIAVRASLAIQNAQLYKSVQDNERKFKAFIDSNIVGVFTADSEGTITECNDGFLKITGYSREELETTKLNREQLSPPEYKVADKKAAKELRKKGSSTPREKEYLKRDGSQVPVIVGSIMVDRSTNENISIVLDITERKRLEQRKDEFIGIASHELKTPLTSIKGYVQILERIIEEMGNDKAIKIVSKTNVYIDRLNSLITDLLDVSKIQAGKLQFTMREFDVYDLIVEGIDGIQPTTNKHIITCDECLHVSIKGDKNRLEQVFMNLISNAIKYSPNADKIIVTVNRKGGSVIVSITDFGVGISKRSQHKLFQRFYRVEKTASKFSGLGIGLYISSEIIQRHGGKIWLESEEGKGSTFYFSLPISSSN